MNYIDKDGDTTYTRGVLQEKTSEGKTKKQVIKRVMRRPVNIIYRIKERKNTSIQFFPRQYRNDIIRILNLRGVFNVEDRTFELLTRMYSEFSKKFNDMDDDIKGLKNDVVRIEDKLDTNAKALFIGRLSLT
jgi:hypothetical protein